ncbi:Rossmann-fold NAD(P)-binding domain-containing protein [Constantimarinum furrinae]|uniref:6-phosphogluconate dehydrogenase-like protein n=1 Tax=Constantimarinum furrinae TaxID=2562285 RepID=A0A7G8PSR8_9FLAO|nr:SDR family NAD(P)-dependent oxidoreductase [Constantimarinum furrinae]QNJ97384.1 6-phosphogluconate dehydrogenase-like protein [Constantimarinum furrinae]
MNKTIVITGLGWLGTPLARHLMQKRYSVKGSVTSLQKATKLQANGIDAYPLLLSECGIDGDPNPLFKNSDFLIVMIPPGLRKNTGANYVLKMSHFLKQIQQSSVSKVVFVSSTSVYGDYQGRVTEAIKPEPDTEAGKQILTVENMFFSSEQFSCSIVRFGGLIGGSRQPVRYLAGRSDLNNGTAPVNLIHREDCIAILSEIIAQDAFGYVFNAVHPHHPLKQEYYLQKAKELHVSPPQFSEDKNDQSHKQVDSESLKEILNYTFRRSI